MRRLQKVVDSKTRQLDVLNEELDALRGDYDELKCQYEATNNDLGRMLDFSKDRGKTEAEFSEIFSKTLHRLAEAKEEMEKSFSDVTRERLKREDVERARQADKREAKMERARLNTQIATLEESNNILKDKVSSSEEQLAVCVPKDLYLQLQKENKRMEVVIMKLQQVGSGSLTPRPAWDQLLPVEMIAGKTTTEIATDLVKKSSALQLQKSPNSPSENVPSTFEGEAEHSVYFHFPLSV